MQLTLAWLASELLWRGQPLLVFSLSVYVLCKNVKVDLLPQNTQLNRGES